MANHNRSSIKKRSIILENGIDHFERGKIEFAVEFVVQFCEKRKEYDIDTDKPGKWTEVAGPGGSALGGTIAAIASASTGAPIPLTAGMKAGRVVSIFAVGKAGSTAHAKKSREIVGRTPLFATNKEIYWKLLVGCALEITRIYGYQFRVICGTKYWETNVKKLARDAVNRVFNFFYKNCKDEEEFDANTKSEDFTLVLVKAVIFGESKETVLTSLMSTLCGKFLAFPPGLELHLRKGLDWNTSEFFKYPGLITKDENDVLVYLCKKKFDRYSYGFRNLHIDEEFKKSDYNVIKNFTQEEFPFNDFTDEVIERVKDTKYFEADTNKTVHETKNIANDMNFKLDKLLQNNDTPENNLPSGSQLRSQPLNVRDERLKNSDQMSDKLIGCENTENPLPPLNTKKPLPALKNETLVKDHIPDLLDILEPIGTNMYSFAGRLGIPPAKSQEIRTKMNLSGTGTKEFLADVLEEWIKGNLESTFGALVHALTKEKLIRAANGVSDYMKRPEH